MLSFLGGLIHWEVGGRPWCRPTVHSRMAGLSVQTTLPEFAGRGGQPLCTADLPGPQLSDLAASPKGPLSETLVHRQALSVCQGCPRLCVQERRWRSLKGVAVTDGCWWLPLACLHEGGTTLPGSSVDFLSML